MTDFSIDKLFRSIGQMDDNTKVFIDAKNSELEVSNTQRSIFKKSQSADLNEKAKNTLSILKAALESSLNAKGLEIYNQFITGKKAQGTQRLTVADFKAIGKIVNFELGQKTNYESLSLNNSLSEYFHKEVVAECLPRDIEKADEKFEKLDKNSLSEIKYLLNDYNELNSKLDFAEEKLRHSQDYRKNIESQIKKLQSLLNSKANTYANFSSYFNIKLNSIVVSTNALENHISVMKTRNWVDHNDSKLTQKYDSLIKKLDTIRKKYMKILVEFNKTANLDIMQHTEVPAKYFKIFKDAISSAKKDLVDIIKSSEYPNKNLVKDTYNTHLGKNKNGWFPLKKDVEVTFQGVNQKLKSNIIPVNALENKNVDYGQDIKGIPSSDTTSPHLTNFCKTQLATDEEQPKVLFEGYRHGVMDAYDVENHNTRVEYNNQKAMEFVTTVVGDKYSDAIANGTLGNSINNPIKLTINSFSLLTPANKEGTMQENQVAALKGLCRNGQPYSIQVKVNGNLKNVYVQPTVNTFDFSTNHRGHSIYSKSVWHTANSKYNNDGFNAMFGNDIKTKPSRNEKLQSNLKDLNVYSFRAFINKFQDDAHKNTSLGKFLATANQTDQKKAYILYSEIQLLKQNRKYSNKGADLFALPARMAMLSHLMGEVTSFNCKSGNDHTGVLDVRVKALAARMDTITENNNPESYLKNESSIVKNLVKKEKYNDDDQNNITSIAQDGGNLEIQKYNTGINGSKIIETDMSVPYVVSDGHARNPDSESTLAAAAVQDAEASETGASALITSAGATEISTKAMKMH